MCGITGFISKELNQEHLKVMTDKLSHRGPNAEGFYYNEADNIGLGHRRLSILDLSESANQPFYSDDNRYVIVFNGEVYNYREIQKKYNISCKTTSDTEVILKGFILKGVEIFNEFNGMFAFTIWDTQKKELIIVRDRLGIKPIYYYHKDNEFLFASEIKALTSIKKFIHNPQAIADFLYLGYTPEAVTFYKEVLKFPAGHYGILKNNSLAILPFWKAEDKIESQKRNFKSFTEAKDELKKLLTSSVEYRLISDVSVGTFLSGGTDSSIVTAIAQSISDKPVKTFSIGFKEAKFNESVHAKEVAKHLGTEHHEYILSQDDALGLFDSLLDTYDEPFADSSCIPTMLVSQMAKKEVTVALSGDGGDELFMGYGSYKWARRINNPFLGMPGKAAAPLMKSLGNNRVKRVSDLLNYGEKSKIKSHIFSQEQYYFTQNEIKKLLNPNFRNYTPQITEEYTFARKISATEEQAFFDLKHYLKDDLLKKVDIASMVYSLEVRVPILDYRVVEFALNLDEKFKVQKGVDKFLLKELLYDYAPKKLFDRPKWGFGLPLGKWLREDLSYMISENLSKESIESAGIVNYEVVQKIKKDFLSGQEYLYNRIWLLILLHKWIKKNKQ
jgi:asparagine synthase (glutamine-hydrolysing)